MKVDYVADLHVNHWMWFIMNQEKWQTRTREWTRRLIRHGNGEVLLLGGDFSESNNQTIWLLDEVSKYYDRVYWTFGNHDLYLLSKRDRERYRDSLGRLKELIESTSHLKNVVPLIKNVDIYKGKTFAGDALWYLPKGQEGWDFYKGVMSDSSDIKINGVWGEDVPRFMYKESMEWYDSLEGRSIDVMLTHVPPVHIAQGLYGYNSCYQTDVPFLVSEHWVCAHNHFQGTFKKAGTNFYMNSIGYPKEYSNVKENIVPGEEVDNILTFDVRTFEI